MKFMCTHTLGPNALTYQHVREMQQAAQKDPEVRGDRAFVNLTEGKVVCVLEAPSRKAVAGWFEKMGMPFDSITPVEIESSRGEVVMEELPEADMPVGTGMSL